MDEFIEIWERVGTVLPALATYLLVLATIFGSVAFALWLTLFFAWLRQREFERWADEQRIAKKAKN